jgi:D-lactate dehydrogenase (cytochrome)
MIIKEDKADFESYLVDAANIKGDCQKVYFPENEEEVCLLFKQANKSGLNITISAGRTGLNGGSVPKDGILISMEKLNKIISIDRVSKTAIVQPGVILADFQQEVEKERLFYPPDPTETNCSIGGTVANNASGARTFKYGSTRNFVEELTVILPTGEILRLKRGIYIADDHTVKIKLSENYELIFSIPNYTMPEVKHSAGYFCKPNMDLIDLFIGAEGTLGVITSIKLKLLELPQNVISMIIFFNDENNIFSFVDEIRKKSKKREVFFDFREIEFFDKNTLSHLMEDYQNIPLNSQGAVWIEQEFDEIDEENILFTIEKTVEKHNGDLENIWFAVDSKEKEKLKEFRHKIALKVNDIISSRGLVKVGTDTAVPDDKFEDFYSNTKHLIEKHNLEYVVYGHIGNSHLHFNMLPKNTEELTMCRELYAEICSKSIELGGTISAEHGIGKLKTKYLLEMFGEESILQMAKLKKILDPNMILNIGNIFEEKYLKMII